MSEHLMVTTTSERPSILRHPAILTVVSSCAAVVSAYIGQAVVVVAAVVWCSISLLLSVFTVVWVLRSGRTDLLAGERTEVTRPMRTDEMRELAEPVERG